jgi:hypothetical protein
MSWLGGWGGCVQPGIWPGAAGRVRRQQTMPAAPRTGRPDPLLAASIPPSAQRWTTLTGPLARQSSAAAWVYSRTACSGVPQRMKAAASAPANAWRGGGGGGSLGPGGRAQGRRRGAEEGRRRGGGGSLQTCAGARQQRPVVHHPHVQQLLGDAHVVGQQEASAAEGQAERAVGPRLRMRKGGGGGACTRWSDSLAAWAPGLIQHQAGTDERLACVGAVLLLWGNEAVLLMRCGGRSRGDGSSDGLTSPASGRKQQRSMIFRA